MWGKVSAIFALIVFAGGAAAVPVYKIQVPAGFHKVLPVGEAKDLPEATCLPRAQDCLVFTGESEGHAFENGDSRKLTTSLHLFSDYLKATWERSDDVQNLHALIQINGRREWATFSVSEAAQRALKDDTLKNHPELDRVNMTLTRDPVTPLNFSGIKPHMTKPFAQDVLLTAFSEEGAGVVGFGDYECFETTSGSPVLNKQGEVVGIHTGQLDAGPAGTACYFLKF